jgi:hypothetical protein
MVRSPLRFFADFADGRLAPRDSCRQLRNEPGTDSVVLAHRRTGSGLPIKDMRQLKIDSASRVEALQQVVHYDREALKRRSTWFTVTGKRCKTGSWHQRSWTAPATISSG